MKKNKPKSISPKKKRVFIIYNDLPHSGCYFYRVENFKEHAHNFLVTSDVDYEKNRLRRHSQIYREIFAADIVIFVRPIFKKHYLLMKSLKNLGKIIITDIDDYFWQMDRGNPSYVIIRQKLYQVTEKFIKESDAITCTNNYLKKALLKLNKKVFVVPNFIDSQALINYRKKLKAPKDNKKRFINIGLSGSVNTIENLKSFKKILHQVHNENKNVRLIFFGGEEKVIQKVKEEFKTRIKVVKSIPFNQYFKTLEKLKLDFLLIPRKDNFFNRCKSNCKFLEMSLLKIPVIAQGYQDKNSPYQIDIVDGKNGFLVIQKKDWLKKINLLLNNRKLIKEIGQKAFDYVTANYEIKDKIKDWETILNKVYNDNFKADSKNLETAKLLSEFNYLVLSELEEIYYPLQKDNRKLNRIVADLNNQIQNLNNSFEQKIKDKYRDLKLKLKKNFK
jgi:glycosyltransferase involved in cell wall biosynthesis